jgi:hypothetical protein
MWKRSSAQPGHASGTTRATASVTSRRRHSLSPASSTSCWRRACHKSWRLASRVPGWCRCLGAPTNRSRRRRRSSPRDGILGRRCGGADEATPGRPAVRCHLALLMLRATSSFQSKRLNSVARLNALVARLTTSAGVQAEVLPFDRIVTQLDSAGAVCSAWEPARLAARTASSQWPGTARSSTSAARWLLQTRCLEAGRLPGDRETSSRWPTA